MKDPSLVIAMTLAMKETYAKQVGAHHLTGISHPHTPAISRSNGSSSKGLTIVKTWMYILFILYTSSSLVSKMKYLCNDCGKQMKQ